MCNRRSESAVYTDITDERVCTMKKLLVLLLSALLLLGLCACAAKPQEEPEKQDETDLKDILENVFPDGVTICGTDVSGMTDKEAETAVLEAVAGYSLKLMIAGREPAVLSAAALKLTCTADFTDLARRCSADSSLRNISEEILTYDFTPIESMVQRCFDGLAAEDAVIEFDATAKEFRISAEEAEPWDPEAAKALADEAVLSLEPELLLDDAALGGLADRIEADQRLRERTEWANERLALSLEYSFTPSGMQTATEKIGRDEIAGFLAIIENGTDIEIDSDAVTAYTTEIGQNHSIYNTSSTFVTTSGVELNVRVPTPGQTVNTDALFNDLMECLKNAISGKREAPYIEHEAVLTSNFGGNYVEIDLSSQMLWVYCRGEMILSSPIVSGCVNIGNATPTGVYYIAGKSTNTYLVGPGYRSYVNYWMPFNGNIGLHDADGWRGAYGGSIYLYDGSHGCVNMPTSTARTIYNNLPIGTAVILYGGITEVPPLTQSIRGTETYRVVEGGDPFTLDAEPAYEADLTYSSDNTAVATVDKSGKVRIKSVGTANITVTAKEKRGFTAATKTVTVTVLSRCEYEGHTWNDGIVTKAVGCETDGEMTYTCKNCGETKTEVLAAAGHLYDEGTVTKLQTCTEDGVRTYACTVCGKTKTEAIAASGHSWGEAYVTLMPDCETPGEVTYTCSVCTATKTETVPAKGHDYEGGFCVNCGKTEPVT